MKVIITKDRAELGKTTGELAAGVIRNCLSQYDLCNLVVATGSSQFEVLESLIRQPGIDWTRVCGFHLDEYLGLSQTHAASFCGYLKERFVDRVPLKSFLYLDGTIPPAELRSSASTAMADKRIDLMLCGIGENGHLAFNDPPADFTTTEPYLIVDLDEACRRQQVGEGWFDNLEQVPTQAISMSIRQILKADVILCSVPDRRKAEAVRSTLEAAISPAIPASALRNHSNTTLVLDAESSHLLSPATLAQCHVQN